MPKYLFFLVFICLVHGFKALQAQSITELEAGLAASSDPAVQWNFHYKLARNYLIDQPNRAIAHAEACQKLAITLSDQKKTAQAALVLGDIYTKLGQKDKALLAYTQAQKVAFEQGAADIEFSAVDNLEALSVENKDFDQAYAWKTARQRILQAQTRSASEQQNLRISNLENALKAEQNKQLRWILLGLSGFALVFFVALSMMRRSGRRVAGELAEKNALIEEKRRRSEQLLLNILPRAVAAELTVRNKVAARRYEYCTVMFVDFVGFTKIAEQLSPEVLVEALDHCFSQFDTIIGRYRIEKIKTVGDAYICASGLSDRNDHPAEMIKAALQMQAFLQQFELKHGDQRFQFNARIGIHYGPVVAGIVGTKKFAYDIWGDTVNTAARMEAASSPGQINVSGAVQAVCAEEFTWHYRGKIATKNKEELDMYFVTVQTNA